MSTIRLIEANRANAARSTGPRTAAGKARARMNAVRHGLAGRGTRLTTTDVCDPRVQALIGTAAGGADDAFRVCKAAVAQCTVDLARVQAAATALIERILAVAGDASADAAERQRAPG